MLFMILLVLWKLPLSICSEVIDKATQAGVYIDEYCPKMPFCAEGAHTMCMFYNPRHPYGPRCFHYQNISVTFGVADTLLDLINEMRGQMALGKETGQGNVQLPRGYGMFKLKWDNELATFAQVLANTCVLRIDLCRATKRFEDPGQLASLVRFTIPDWLPVLHRQTFSEKGLVPSKVEYAAKEACKSWYQQKQFVTVAMLNNTPNWLEHPSRTQGKQFLQLIDGRATHVGCGVSGYAEYAYHGNEIIYNAIEVICNFSTSPRKGTAVYRMTNPDDGCGCPANYDHDDRCLCTEPKKKIPDRTCGKDKNCKPAVVLLPIFTVEDAPENKISRKARRRSESKCKHSESLKSMPTIITEMDIEDHDEQESEPKWDQNKIDVSRVKYKRTDLGFEMPTKAPQEPSDSHDDSIDPDSKHHEAASYIYHSLEYPYNTKRVSVHKTKRGHQYEVIDAHNNHYNNSLSSNFNSNYLHPSRRAKERTDKKSIFSRGPKFELPSIKNNRKREFPKPDVTPRKFSDMNKILDTYLNDKRKGTINKKMVNSDTKNIVIKPRFKIPKSTANINETEHAMLKTNLEIIPVNKNLKENFVKTEHTVPKENRTRENKISPNNNENDESFKVDLKNVDDVADKKLMTLLDNLEQEVKHIELDKSEKNIFDVKIRKIYNTVVGKPQKIQTHNLHELDKQTLQENLEDEPKTKESLVKSETNLGDITFSDYDNIDDLDKKKLGNYMTDTEDRVTKLHTKHQDNDISKLHLVTDSEYPKSIYAQPGDFEISDIKSERTNFQNDEKRDSELYHRKGEFESFNNMEDEKFYKNYDKGIESSLPVKPNVDYKSKEIERNENIMRSVPYQSRSMDRQEQSGSGVYIRNEMEIGKPRIHFQNKDLEKREQFNARSLYLSEIQDRKKLPRRPNMFYLGKRSGLKFDDDKGTNLNSIDEPKVRYEEDIWQSSHKIHARPKKYYENEGIVKTRVNDAKEYEEDLLDEDRRKFYQDKLNNLQRKIQRSDDKRYRNNQQDLSRQLRRRLLKRHRVESIKGDGRLVRSRQEEDHLRRDLPERARLRQNRLERGRLRASRLGEDRIAENLSRSKFFVPDRA